MLLAKYQVVLLDGIKPEDPKYASLAKSFATVQGDLKSLEISYTQVEVVKSARIAGLSNTQIDTPTYQKLRAGMPEFKTGEVFVAGNTMISRADTTGARTVMDIKSGERWKERNGLQIRSDVPTESPESKKARETIVTKEASVANLQKGIQGDVGYLTRVTSDPEIRKSLSLSTSLTIDASSPEKLTQSLTALRGSILKSIPSDPPTGEEKNLLSKIESLIGSQNTPGGKLEQLQLEKAALKTLQSQSAILPVQDQIRLRDQAIDANLSILTRFGLHHLGQEKFNVLEKSLQGKLSGSGTAVFDLQKPLLGTDPDQQEILAQMIARLINTNPSTLPTSLYTREKGISSTAGDTLKGKQFSTQDIERAVNRL